MSTSPPLFQAYPTLRDTLAHQSLGSFPTPLTQLQAIGRRVGSPSLWCKRDDLSAEEYGGNKVRKLEWILAHATQQSAKRLFTVGCLGSHHVLLAGLAATSSLDRHLACRSPTLAPLPPRAPSRLSTATGLQPACPSPASAY